MRGFGDHNHPGKLGIGTIETAQVKGCAYLKTGNARGIQRTGQDAIFRAVRNIEKQLEFEAQHGQPRQLVANGHWLVPPQDRPAGWQKWNVQE